VRLHRVLLLSVILLVLALSGCGSKTIVVYKTVTAAPDASPAATSAAPSENTPQSLELVKSGWALTQGYVEYGVVIRNPNAAFAANFPTIDIEMLGKNGQIIAAENQVLNLAMPGQTVAWGGQSDPNGKRPAKVHFSLSVGQDNWLTTDSPDYEGYEPFTISKVSVGKDSLGSVVVTGKIKNTNDQTFDSVAVSVILKSPAGRVVAGFTGYADNLAATSSKSFEVTSLGTVPAFESVEVYAQRW
jgi:hypothetical protein